MKDIKSWLFILIAIIWLLPLVKITSAAWMDWVAVIALAVIGFLGLKGE
tara:strand:+ start:76 stop:222 length:147 start_codon:yes stop_codon:yes gene_type:complete